MLSLRLRIVSVLRYRGFYARSVARDDWAVQVPMKRRKRHPDGMPMKGDVLRAKATRGHRYVQVSQVRRAKGKSGVSYLIVREVSRNGVLSKGVFKGMDRREPFRIYFNGLSSYSGWDTETHMPITEDTDGTDGQT